MKTIHRASATTDVTAIRHLILSLIDVFIADRQNATAFLGTLSLESIEKRLASSDFDYWIARSDQGHIHGVIGVRSRTHLYHLFVDPNFQGNGLGTALWEHAQSELAGSIRTVNAAPNAAPFYQRLGFMDDGNEVHKDGLAFVPMSIQRHAG